MATNDLMNATTTGGMVGWLSGNNPNVQDALAFGSAVGADLLVYICQYSDSATIAGVSQQPGTYSALNPSAVWSGVFAHETAGHCYGRSHSDGVLNPKTIMLHNYCGGGAAPPYFYTNPNIWFNGVQLLGDGVNNCGMGSLVNNGDNSSPSAQAIADHQNRIIVGPNLNNVILHWSFTNAPGPAPAGTTNLDLVSASPAVVRGNGATYTGTALRLPGGTTGNTPADSIAAYIDLPNGIISSQTNITIEIWATPLSAPNFARIFDFGRAAQAGDGLGGPGEYTGLPGTPAPGTTQSSDNILLSDAIGTDITQQRFEARLGGTATTLDANLATTAGVQHHYAATFTDGAGSFTTNGGRWQWFRDGDAVAYLDVNFHLANIQDVNNWLGRSQWSADSLANNDYAEVRISNVVLSRGQILANYLLGPNYVPTATVTLTNSDSPSSSSFNSAGQWSNGAIPSAGNTYETLDYQLRTPATSGGFSFAGNSLTVSGGSLLWVGIAGSLNVNNLILNSGTLRNSGTGACTLTGNISATTNGGIFSGVSGPFTISSTLSGNGPFTFLAGAATLSGASTSLTGKLFVGNGQPGTIVIDSQARLGASPPAFISDQLTLNRGTVQTTTSFSLNDTNRGILLAVSGGTFNVASGTTLTLSSTLSSTVTASGIVVGSLTKAGPGTLILSSTSNTFKGTLNVDTASTTTSDGIVKIVNNQVLANAHSPIFIRNNNTGSSTLQLDGSTGNLTLSQGIAVSCRNTSIPTIENLAGTNSINGNILLNVGGSLFNIQSDAGQLIFRGANQYIGSLTGARSYTFLGNGNHLVSGPILNSTNGAPISLTKSGSGTLILAGTNTYGGSSTLNGGTLLVNGVVGSGGVTVTSGTLGGNGVINGPVTMQSGTKLSPGTSIGVLTVNNSVSLQTGSTSIFELNKSTVTNDQLRVTGTLTYGGTLSLTNLAGTLAAGDTFKLFNAGTYTGYFAALQPPAPGQGLVWNTNSLTLNGTLQITLASPPLISSPAFDGQNFLFQVTNSAPGSGYSVLTSTNLAFPLTNWSLLSTGLFDSFGNSPILTNPVNSPTQQLFFRLRVP
jgi:autotransporter-associated beta strand protein